MMGLTLMSTRELNRLEILAQVSSGRQSIDSGANMLGICRRQLFRLLQRFKTTGPASVAHKARGKRPNNRISDVKRDYVLSIVSESYADFGPTLATEMLAERHGLKVSRETLRKWMIGAGNWLSRKQRRQFHQPRNRRECYGELIQIDGSDHRWFEGRAAPCTVLVFIDDATGCLMQLRFVESESTFSYFEALEGYLAKHGRPVAFYSDKHTVFRHARPNERGNGMTQFGRALAELNIEMICANSSQAKGRVERVNRTLQDRLVKELRLAGVLSIEAGNAFLEGFTERFNAKFARLPARPDNLHRSLNVEPVKLGDVLCLRDQRYVGAQLTFQYDRRKFMLDLNEMTRGLPGQYIDTYEDAMGEITVRWKGVQLAYTVFDNSRQQISQSTIVENKRLGAVLAFIKLKQEQAAPPVVYPSSDKNNYQKKGYAAAKTRIRKPKLSPKTKAGDTSVLRAR